MNKPPSVNSDFFAHGARWIRADFHLHTQADKEFKSSDRVPDFNKRYVSRLLEEEVFLGVVTNHNKFDCDEFRSLRKEAKRSGILLLPGIELSLQGGKGVHALVVFEPDTWIDNAQGEDFINRLLDAAFPQVAKPQRESENANSDWHLGTLLDELESHHQRGRDSFIVMAHVDDAKGCLHELRSQLATFMNDAFQRYVLAFQKARSRENWKNLKQWTGSDWQPARVEGSDCKELAEVGRCHVESGDKKFCYLKFGDLTFAAVRLALVMHRERVAEKFPERENAWIESISFEAGTTGILGSLDVNLNPDMNDLIGIRGSGKSSILECLRYAFGINLSEQGSDDPDYKDQLVGNALSSGGKITVRIRKTEGQEYVIERIFKEAPKVSSNGSYRPNLRPSGLLRCHYFGQKDLAKLGARGSTGELLERFVAPKLTGIREQIFGAQQQVVSSLAELRRIGDTAARLQDTRAELAAVRESLKVFEQHKVEAKLKEQLQLQRDRGSIKELLETLETFRAGLSVFVSDFEDSVLSLAVPESQQSADLFAALSDPIRDFKQSFTRISKEQAIITKTMAEVQAVEKQVGERWEEKIEAFAKIKRSLSLEKISADTFLELNRKLETLKTKSTELEKLMQKRVRLDEALRQKLKTLQDLRRAEFQERERLAEELTPGDVALRIVLTYRGNVDAFSLHLQDLVRGSGVQTRAVEKVASLFPDGIELFLDLQSPAPAVRSAFASDISFEKFREAVLKQTEALVNMQTPDGVEVLYREKLLSDHSLGQRATALILFILTQADFDCLILDQPEDDLDNQTIYEDVIRLVLQLKGKRQLIFATHNPNIPVLGDAEQVIRCALNGKVTTLVGSVDKPGLQQEIVNVMEGGRDAFERRNQIYQLWMPLKS